MREGLNEFLKTATEQEINQLVSIGINPLHGLATATESFLATPAVAKDSSELKDEDYEALTLLFAMALDDAEQEAHARGEKEAHEAHEAHEAEDSMSFEESIAASAASSKAYWDGVKQRSRSTGNNAGYQHCKKTLGNKPVAVDHVAVNAKAAKPYSLFAHPERMKRATTV